MYRVYDTREKVWVDDKMYVTQHGDIAEINKTVFGREKAKLRSEKRYIYYRDIGNLDKNGVLIFEGDILQTDDGMIGLVHYSVEQAAFVLLDYKESKFYSLGSGICSKLTVIGNVCRNKEFLLEGIENKEDSNV